MGKEYIALSKELAASLHISYFGYGFLEAWSICLIFFHGGDSPAHSSPGLSFAMTNASSMAIVLGTMLVALVSRRHELAAHRKLATCLAACVQSFATALVVFGGAQVKLVGYVLAGLMGSWLWVVWGDVLARFDTAGTESVAMGSATLQAIVSIGILSLPALPRAMAVLACAPASAVAYLFATSQVERDLSIVDAAVPERQFHAPIPFDHRFYLRMLAGIGVPIASIYYLVDRDVSLAPMADAGSTYVVGLLLFLAALYGFVRFGRGLVISSICRVLCMLLVLGLGLAGLGANRGIVSTFIFADMLLSQYLPLMYAARLYGQGFGTIIFSFAVVMFVNHFGGLVGSLTSAFVHDALGAPVGEVTIQAISAFSILLFFTVALLGENDAVGQPTDPSAVPFVSGMGGEAIERALDDRVAELSALHGLSARESEVLALLARGRSAPFIRDELVISLNTVTSHVKHIYVKLGVHSRQELLDLVEGPRDSAPQGLTSN